MSDAESRIENLKLGVRPRGKRWPQSRDSSGLSATIGRQLMYSNVLRAFDLMRIIGPHLAKLLENLWLVLGSNADTRIADGDFY